MNNASDNAVTVESLTQRGVTLRCATFAPVGSYTTWRGTKGIKVNGYETSTDGGKTWRAIAVSELKSKAPKAKATIDRALKS